ncbi:MAG: LytTR family DNA-binding domain-containing protein [Bacteroidota bacterium]
MMKLQTLVGLPTGTEILLYAPETILYCLGEGEYSYLVFENGETGVHRVILQRTIAQLESSLPNMFLRINEVCIVNTWQIKSLRHNNENTVLMSDGEEFRVIESKQVELMSRYLIL